MLPPKVQQQPQIQPPNIPYVDVQRQRRQRPPNIGIFESIIGAIILMISSLMLTLGLFLAGAMIGSSELTMFSAVHEIEAILLIGLGLIGLAQGTMLLRKK